jgi:hypothetical protein
MMHLLLRGSVIVALALGLVGPAAAESLGIAGYSGEFGVDCNACHSGGTVPSVTITGPLQVPVGTIATYELKIVSGDLQQTHGGLDVSDTDGTLIATEAGTEILSGELVHSAPREQNASREVIFRFDWQAPAAPGQVTLYGAGNSVNNAQALLGDAAATDTLTVDVLVATPGESSGPGLAPLLVTAFDKETEELTVSFETACETTGNNVYFGPLDQVSNYVWSGAECNVGDAGTASFNPGLGSFFFLIVGNRHADEGSYGRADDADPKSERPPYDPNPCGPTQTLAATCD